MRRRPSEVVVQTRSLLEILFFLSHTVEVPVEHEERGLVTVTRGESGERFDWSLVVDGLFRVASSRAPPESAFVAVRHRGAWFWIPDDDLDSKSTFMLISQLFQLLAGTETPQGPALTIPVR